MNDVRKKLIFCIIGNLFSLSLVVIALLCMETNGPYWRIGPNSDLIIISARIDTYTKYWCLLAAIALVNVSKIFSEEVGMPILGFNVYNPDKKVITDFGKLELQVMANTMFSISSIRSMLMVVVSISQIDVSFWSVIVQEICTLFTIRMILNEKEFKKEGTGTQHGEEGTGTQNREEGTGTQNREEGTGTLHGEGEEENLLSVV